MTTPAGYVRGEGGMMSNYKRLMGAYANNFLPGETIFVEMPGKGQAEVTVLDCRPDKYGIETVYFAGDDGVVGAEAVIEFCGSRSHVPISEVTDGEFQEVLELYLGPQVNS